MFVSQPLPLEGTYNTRDIGNYPASRGRKTQTHRFLRSDSTENLTEQDMEFLQNYGLSAVFDLRSSVELKANPSPLEKEPWIDYYHFELLDHLFSEGNGAVYPASLFEMYQDLLDTSVSVFVRIFQTAAAYPKQTILYNCTAGKDRTGILTFLLLDVAGVSDDQIIEDYAVSGKNIIRKFEQHLELSNPERDAKLQHLFGSPAGAMEKTIAYFRNTYHNAREYLSSAGLSKTSLDLVEKALLEAP